MEVARESRDLNRNSLDVARPQKQCRIEVRRVVVNFVVVNFGSRKIILNIQLQTFFALVLAIAKLRLLEKCIN